MKIRWKYCLKIILSEKIVAEDHQVNDCSFLTHFVSFLNRFSYVFCVFIIIFPDEFQGCLFFALHTLNNRLKIVLSEKIVAEDRQVND
jgi:hypothetical protein